MRYLLIIMVLCSITGCARGIHCVMSKPDEKGEMKAVIEVKGDQQGKVVYKDKDGIEFEFDAKKAGLLEGMVKNLKLEQ